MPQYWFGKTVATTYEETLARATAALAERASACSPRST